MNKNSKEPRSTNSGDRRMYLQRKKHRPLFQDELQDEVRSAEQQVQRNVPAERFAKPVQRGTNRGKVPKGIAGYLRFAKIAAKVIFEEVVDFFKRLYARRTTRTVVTAAVVCVVGVAAIISVAAAAASSRDSELADASLAPDANQVIEAIPGGEVGNTDKAETESPAVFLPSNTEAPKKTPAANDADTPVVTETAAPKNTETSDEPDATEAKTEETEDTSADYKVDEDEKSPEEDADTNTVTVTFWDKDSIVLESDAKTVGDFLAQSGIELTDAQRANIDESFPIGGDITISADVVTYDKVDVEEVLEFDTEYLDSTSYPAGTTQITQYGANGSQTRQFTVTYVNGVEVDRVQTASWIDSSPTTQIVVNGIGSSFDGGDIPNGEIAESVPDSSSGSSGGTFVGADGVEREYLYYIDVRATCYYVGGTTASGLPANEDVIAVDPSVIPLGTKVYVTGSYGDFGERIAADTGGNIKGYVIDVCIDPSDPRAGSFGWRDMRVYFLA